MEELHGILELAEYWVNWFAALALFPPAVRHVRRSRLRRSHPLPARRYIIGSGGRAGSGLLAHAMTATGQLGFPDEFLLDSLRPRWAAEWGLRRRGEDDSEFHASMLRSGTTPNGVFGMKLMTGTAWRLALEMERAPSHLTRQRLEFLSQTVVVHVRRRDKVAAAFSHWRGLQTGEWLRFDRSITASGTAPLIAPPDAWVERYHRSLHWSDAFWLRVGEQSGECIDLWYEDFCTDVGSAVGRIGAALGISELTAPPIESLPTKVVDPRIRSMIDSWAWRTGGCPECGEARR